MVIWKFEIPHAYPVAAVALPVIRTPLAVGEQNGRIVLWAAVDTDSPVRTTRFHIVATGDPVPESAAFYRGTVQMPTGTVWHVFEGQS